MNDQKRNKILKLSIVNCALSIALCACAYQGWEPIQETEAPPTTYNYNYFIGMDLPLLPDSAIETISGGYRAGMALPSATGSVLLLLLCMMCILCAPKKEIN